MTKKNVDLTFLDLKKKVSTYIKDKKQLDLIVKAYEYASEQHFGVKRASGEDYITHPLNVAYILTEINADSATICAGLLHDVLEDCDVTKEEMQERFGEEITNLVEGVTKINKLNLSADTDVMIANHRKILVGLSNDVRVIIIKLADRLHNMRTIWALPVEKQKKKAKETLDILTPIAHRLGINHYKSELEDLSLRYYKPDAYFSIVERLNQTKLERDTNVADMISEVSNLLKSNHIKHEIKGRSKSIYSIYKKLDKGKKFSEIFDLLALRVFVKTEQECYQALGIIHSKFKPLPKRFKDYIAMPKTNMYQSLHTTVFGVGGFMYEIQIRTYEMDEIAENGIASHWSYKEKGSNVKANMQNDMEQKLQFFKSIIELQKDDINDEEFVRSVKEEVFNHTIYVYTPNGDVIELPNGSTPIDFAYKIHTEVGDKMVGALVNGSIVPFDYVLKNNDIVKVNTNKNSIGPSREWLNMAKTTQAKNKIKAFFNKIDKEEYLKNGQELLSKELRKKKLVINEFLSNDNINKILHELKYSTIDELYINLGSNKIPVGQVINIILDNNETKEEIILRKTQHKNIDAPKPKGDIIIEGITDIKINIASCCKPIPGDRINGYITKGYGITVHRMVCPNLFHLNHRTIDVKWNDDINKKYPTSILIESTNNNILVNIISKTSTNDIIVQSVNNLNSSENYLYDMTVLVENKEKLMKFINDIESMSDIVKVERIIK